MPDPREYLTLADIAKPVSESAEGLNLNSIVSFVKDLKEAIQAAQGLARTVRGEKEPEREYHDHSTPKTTEHRVVEKVQPTPSEMIDKAIEMLDFVKKSCGDIPISQVMIMLEQLKGGSNGSADTGKTNSSDGAQGNGENGACEAHTPTAEESPDLRPPGGVCDIGVQSLPTSGNP